VGGSQVQSGHWSREKSCPCCESNTDHPASSLSLYWLWYPGSVIIIIIFITGNGGGGGCGDDDDDDYDYDYDYTVWF
jgi:hypothetical protein